MLAVGNTAALAAWVAWDEALTPQPGYAVWRSGVSLLLTFALGFGLTRLGAKWPAGQQRLALLAGGLVVIGLMPMFVYNLESGAAYLRALAQWGAVVSPVFLTLLVTGYQWWQSLSISQDRDALRAVQVNFYFNLGGLVLLLVINAGQPTLPTATLLLALLVSFGTGLCSLALASLQQSRRRQFLTRINRYWLGMVLGLIGLLVLCGALLGLWLTPETYAAMQAQLDAASAWLMYGVAVLFAILAIPVASILAPIVAWLATWLTIPLPQVDLPPEVPENLEEAAELTQQTPFLEMLRGGGLAWLALLGLVVLLWLALRRYQAVVVTAGGDETRESVFSGELLLQQLRQLFARPATPPTMNYLPLSGEVADPRRVVRAAYQAMLTWAQAAAEPRAPGQTPQSYAQALGQRYPHAQDSLTHLTAIYLQARYAAEAPTPAQAQQAAQASDAICALPASPQEAA